RRWGFSTCRGGRAPMAGGLVRRQPDHVDSKGATVIEVRGLTIRYGGTLAVDDLTFTVKPGSVTGFLGPNGAGKSSTMRAVLGLETPDAGEALVNGRPYTDLRRPLRTMGALLDAAAVHGGRTARAHLGWLARSNGIGAGRVAQVLEQAGLAGAADRRIGGFSLGMKQRLGIAAALLGDPAGLMFDEPLNGLDPEGIRWLRGLLRSLADEGRTVLLSSHLMNEMARTADHVVGIGRGRRIADAGEHAPAARARGGRGAGGRRRPVRPRPGRRRDRGAGAGGGDRAGGAVPARRVPGGGVPAAHRRQHRAPVRRALDDRRDRVGVDEAPLAP